MLKTLQTLTKLLKQDSRLLAENKLAKNKVTELALNLDKDLLKILLSSPEIKKIFFQEVEGILVFDKIKFQSFISNKQFLPDSFTKYKNKIGLTANGEYLSKSKEVVLTWPYKDCILEGGQTKEDAKRQEIFWNETLAPDEFEDGKPFEPDYVLFLKQKSSSKKSYYQIFIEPKAEYLKTQDKWKEKFLVFLQEKKDGKIMRR